MKYLKTLEQHENMMLLENADSHVLEPPKLTGFKSIQTKVFKDLKLDFYFASTFGTAIPLFYPVVEKLISNAEFTLPLSKTNIVLMTIFALAVLLKENESQINKLKHVLREKGLSDMAKLVLKSLQNIKTVFINISKKFGKIIRNMAELFSYTALLVPFMNCLMEYVNTNEISVKTLTGMALGATIAGVTRILIYFSDILYQKLKLKLKNHRTSVYDPDTGEGVLKLIKKTFINVKNQLENTSKYKLVDKVGDVIYYGNIVISKYKNYPSQKDYDYSIIINNEKFDTLKMKRITQILRDFYDYLSEKAKLNSVW
jgi:hypothetical protein